MHRHKRFFLAVFGALAVSMCPLPGATIVFDATDSGWYASTLGHTPANENFFVGADSGNEFRNFFVFDLASMAVPGNILSVTLQIQNVPLGNTAASLQGGEVYEVFDVGNSIADLVSGAASFGDLGTGTSFGMSPSVDGTVPQLVSVVFNMDGRSAVGGALGGLFAVSGIINSIDDGTFLTDGEDLFEGPNTFDVGDTTRQLVIETDAVVIPEPSTIVLVAIGLVGLAGLARRRPA